MRISRLYWFVLLLLLLLPGLGWSPLFDWDEVNFAEISREMIASGDWLRPQVDFAPFWEKPPLFFWLQALAFSGLGVGEYAARLPNALCGLVTALTLFGIGKQWRDARFGLTWAALHVGSVLPLVYFRSGIIDPWFNYFIVVSLWAWFRAPAVSHPIRYVLLCGIAAGLAVLTKGPVALLVIGLVVLISFWWLRPAHWRRILSRGALAATVAVLLILAWLIPLWRIDGGWFATEFVRYQWRLLTTPDAGHGGFPGYHVVVLLFGCFPAAALALPWLWRRQDGEERTPDRWLRTLFWVVLILFSIVQTKIVHYSSLCYFPLSYFAASAILRAQAAGSLPVAWRWKWATAIPFALILFLLPLAGHFQVDVGELFAHNPEVADRLALPVSWPWWTGLPAVIFVFGWGYSYYLVAKNQAVWRGVGSLLVATATATSLALLLLAPRIERYTQGPVREFFVEHSSAQAYLMPLGYKSYLHLFYGRRSVALGRLPENREVWYVTAPEQKPIWIASPTHRRDELETALPAAKHRYDRGGFSFYFLPPASATDQED
jgi:4-amino-4-deoxy-L-arabinose transferase-like glycosyltransferase